MQSKKSENGFILFQFKPIFHNIKLKIHNILFIGILDNFVHFSKEFLVHSFSVQLFFLFVSLIWCLPSKLNFSFYLFSFLVLPFFFFGHSYLPSFPISFRSACLVENKFFSFFFLFTDTRRSQRPWSVVWISKKES